MRHDEIRRSLARIVTAGMLVVAFTLGVLATLIVGGLEDNDQQQSRDSLQIAAENVPPCDSLPGTPTGQVVNDTGACIRDDDVMFLGSFSEQCPDGRTLSWNDFGWGYSDGAWQAHQRTNGQLVPPQPDLDGCRSGG